MQAVVADFIAEGHLSRHIKRMRALYARRRAMLAESLAPYVADGFVVNLQDGGMHLLVDVREDLDDVALACRARDAGFAVRALTTWSNDSPGRRGLLMGFTNISSQAEAQRLVKALFRAFGLPTR
jgi:GntR family transcriptional regulator/MocR family aminotransferase